MAWKAGEFMVKSAGGVAFDAVSAGWYLRNGYPQIYSILSGGLPTWSGEAVNLQTSLNHSVVWACNRIISESIGFIPAILMREKGDEVNPEPKHPMYNAMKMAPNDEISAQGFSEMLTSHCLLTGGAFGRINRRSGTGTAVGIDHLLPEQVSPDRERDGARRLVYTVREAGQADKTYTLIPGRPQDIFHIRGLGWDGIRGYSVITMARQSIGSAIAAERNVARFWAHGGRASFYANLKQKFKTEQDAEAWRTSLEQVANDPNKAIVTDPTWEYNPITNMTMKDAQMLESRQFSIPEICRWFSLPPHMAGDLSRATFSNIEEQFLQFKQMTLVTWINRWELDFWRCVLTPLEKEHGYILRHNVDELMRGDFETRMKGYASALQNGHMNIDEVRAIEKRNKLPNDAGTHYHVQLNMADVEDISKEPLGGRVNPEARDPNTAEAQPTKQGIRRIA